KGIGEAGAPWAPACAVVGAGPGPGGGACAGRGAAGGFPRPAALAAFGQRTKGLWVMARGEVGRRGKGFDVGPAWTFWRGVVLLGIDAPELPEWASISAQQRQLAEAGLPGILPVLKIVGDGSRIWGLDQAGAVVAIDDWADPEPVGGDLIDLYAEQIADLMRRQQDMALRLAERAKGKLGKLPG
ncbi:SMI1/KNR4 family protein, partial [Achromobacter ruhlandii]|uniref:SMI1/KNR4 family protein n=1 Tax=Achromobacter ruhlandii TaxID=72557 RepID=UPI0020160124